MSLFLGRSEYRYIMKPTIWLFFSLCCFLCGDAIATVTEDFSYKWYSVFHKPGQSLSNALTLSTPIRDEGKTFRGHTQWKIHWNFRWQIEPDGQCRLVANTTDLIAVVTIPGLVSGDERAKATFARYVANLKVHEMGHVDIARKAAADIDKGILSLPPMSSCQLLGNAANALGQRRLEQARNEGSQYDKITGHGRTQGAYIK